MSGAGNVPRGTSPLPVKEAQRAWNRAYQLRRLYKDLRAFMVDAYGHSWRTWPTWAVTLLQQLAAGVREWTAQAEAAERAERGNEATDDDGSD